MDEAQPFICAQLDSPVSPASLTWSQVGRLRKDTHPNEDTTHVHKFLRIYVKIITNTQSTVKYISVTGAILMLNLYLCCFVLFYFPVYLSIITNAQLVFALEPIGCCYYTVGVVISQNQPISIYEEA